MSEIRKYLLVVIIALASVFVIWSPFALRIEQFWGINFKDKSMLTIAQNYDAMNFLVVARSWYDPTIIEQNYGTLVGERGTRYFAAHYPLYAGVIAFFDLFLSGPYAIYVSILLSNILFAISLIIFFRRFATDKRMIIPLAILAIFLPPRILPLRAIGSNEFLCLTFILLSIVSHDQKKHSLSAILGALAVLTRSPAILLFGAYVIEIVWKRGGKIKEILGNLSPYLMMPLALLVLWSYYGIVYGDMLAYFKVGGNLNLYVPPFMVFGSELPWVSGFWREDIMYLYIFIMMGVGLLWERSRRELNLRLIAIFSSIYAFSLFFVAHRDVSRYSILIAPLLVLGYGPYIIKFRFHWLLYVLLIPLVLYSWNFILGNIQPIADWTPFL
ncbi:MAG: hypothetical protein DPW11_04010 [bacterium]|nr:hypothetical protein [bacterium]RIK51843.1 MAG: hypothetical protein DCC61_01320 [Candidatus Microgenomates bacterium]